MPGIDSVGETAEKVVPLVRFPVLMRVFLPGLLATYFLYPFTGVTADTFNVKNIEELEAHWLPLLLLAGMVFISGALISALNDWIYKIYEGRTLWPSRLLDFWIARQQAHVQELQKAADKPPSRNVRIENQRRESWDELRTYPMTEDGRYYANSPTRLGNILKGYEQYPKSRYGMSGIFYFPRLWMVMEKESKETIDSGWAIADGFLSLSAAAMGGGVLWLILALLDTTGLSVRLPRKSPGYAVLAGCVSVVLGFVLYRVSLPFHLKNGDTFKAMFDLYRHKLWKMTELEPREKQAWDAAWVYLQYNRLICPNCRKEPQVPGTPCPTCGQVAPTFR